MSCWRFRSELAAQPALAGGLVALLAAGGLAPWLAGVAPLPAALLGATALVAVPAALRAVPGRYCPVVAMAGGPEGLALGWRDGTWLAVEPRAGTRVLPGLVLLLAGEPSGTRRRLWILRGSLPAGEFRRLKALLRAAGDGPGPSSW